MTPSQTPPGPTTPRAALVLGLRESIGLPVAVLAASFLGFGSLVAKTDLPLWLGLASTLTGWALPGQVALVEMAAVGSSVLVIALAVGMADGLGAGDNTRGTLMTRGMFELARLGCALGGRKETFFGLAGIGDMITTCISRHSRNRNFGEAVTQGPRTPDEILAGSIQVVEGVHMTRAALKLSEKLGVELPITKQVHDVLFSGKPPRQAMRELMERELRDEADG